MTFPPSIMQVRIRTDQRRFRLWFPVFVIWPLMALLALLLAPVVVITAILLWPSGRGKPLLQAGPSLFRLLCALRGLEIQVEEPSEQVFISFI